MRFEGKSICRKIVNLKTPEGKKTQEEQYENQKQRTAFDSKKSL